MAPGASVPINPWLFCIVAPAASFIPIVMLPHGSGYLMVLAVSSLLLSHDLISSSLLLLCGSQSVLSHGFCSSWLLLLHGFCILLAHCCLAASWLLPPCGPVISLYKCLMTSAYLWFLQLSLCFCCLVSGHPSSTINASLNSN